MSNQNDNDNVEYEYERPVRSTARFNSASWTVAGLVAAGALLSGGAYAMTNAASSSTETTQAQSVADPSFIDPATDTSGTTDSTSDVADDPAVDESVDTVVDESTSTETSTDENTVVVPPAITKGDGHHSRLDSLKSRGGDDADDADEDGDEAEDADDDSATIEQHDGSAHDESAESEDSEYESAELDD